MYIPLFCVLFFRVSLAFASEPKDNKEDTVLIKGYQWTEHFVAGKAGIIQMSWKLASGGNFTSRIQ